MKILPISIALATLASPVLAAPEGYFDLKVGVTLETGDTWSDASGNRFKLYGVQSCLRGTTFTDTAGNKQDCGDASLAMFAAYIQDTKPICAPLAKGQNITYVFCYATVGKNRLDLASVLITSGFAFAALNQSGMPVYPQYAVAEQQARNEGAGLWKFKDVQHPAILLSQMANQKRSGQ